MTTAPSLWHVTGWHIRSGRRLEWTLHLPGDIRAVVSREAIGRPWRWRTGDWRPEENNWNGAFRRAEVAMAAAELDVAIQLRSALRKLEGRR